MNVYNIPPHIKERIRKVQRGSFPEAIPPHLEIHDIDINGHVRHLSDWLVITNTTLEELADSVRPDMPTAEALGFKRIKLQPSTRVYLDKFPPPLRDIPARTTKLRRFLSQRHRVSGEITHIASCIIFQHAFKFWQQHKDFELPSPRIYFPHIESLDDPEASHAYDTAISLLTDYNFIAPLTASTKYFVTLQGAESLYTDKIWKLGSIEKLSWVTAYGLHIHSDQLYSVAEFLRGKSPGYALFKKQVQKLKIRYKRIMTGDQFLSLLHRLDEEASV